MMSELFYVLGIVLGIIALLVIVFMVTIHIAYRIPREPNTVTPEDYNWWFENLKITNKDGISLDAWWIPAQSRQSHKTVVIIHGWSANKSSMLPLAHCFHEQDYHVLMLDAHNHGESEKNGSATMPKFADDLQSALVWAQTNRPAESEFLVAVGHSVGAAATLLAAARHQTNTNLFIAISSFAHPKLMMQRQLHKLQKIPVLITLISNYIQWVIGYKFDDIAPVKSLQRINQQTPVTPTLLIHGTADQLIPLSDHEMLCEHQSEQVQCIQIEGADHDSIDMIEDNFNIITNFIERHEKKN